MDHAEAFYRMPLGYGPCPGPRQTSQGTPHLSWEGVESLTATITFQTSKTQISTFLPHTCFKIDGLDDTDVAYASISFTRLRNLPWLAGRGYSHCGFYIHDVYCTGSQEQVRGKYLSVLFENLADPVTSGREELGYAKVFASLEEEETLQQFSLSIGWEGHRFGEICLNGLHESPNSALPESHHTSEGILHFKYIPRTGHPGKSDVFYPTFSPKLPESTSTVLRSVKASAATLDFHDLGFEKLPTLHHISSRLAEIKVQKIVNATVTTSQGSSDLREHRAILL